jgi:sec-independent protein translocase protein TatA
MSTGPVLGFISGIGGGELVLIFVLFLMLFGAKKLPGIARSLGKSMAEFQRAAREVREEFLNADRELNKPATPATDAPALPEASASPETDGYGGEGYHPEGDGYGSPETGGPAAEPAAGPIEPVREAAPGPAADAAAAASAVEPAVPAGTAAPVPEGDVPAVQPPSETGVGNVEEVSKT